MHNQAVSSELILASRRDLTILHRLTINFGHHVQVFADSVKFTHTVTPFLTVLSVGKKASVAFFPGI